MIPQFLVTGLSAIVFAIFDPVQPQPAVVPPPPLPPSVNATREVLHLAGRFIRDLTKGAAEKVEREERGGQSNSVVYIFR